MNIQDIQRLFEIRKEAIKLLDEANYLLRSEHDYASMRAYWLAKWDVALGGGEFVDTYEETFKKKLETLGVDVIEAEGDDSYFEKLMDQLDEEEENSLEEG